MAILENRVRIYNKKSKFSLFRAPASISLNSILNLTSLILALFFAFNFYSSYFNSKIIQLNGEVYSSVIRPVKEVVNSGLHIAANFLNFKNLHRENLYLKLENQKLQKNIDKFDYILAENEKLKKDINFSASFGKNSIKAKVLFTSSAKLENNIAVIDAGTANNISENDILLENGYLAGRIVTASENFSKALLINSYKSRIPVKTYNTGLNAILVGNAEKGAYLLHLHGRQKPRIGELIVTSGTGEYFPKNIPVAKIVAVSEKDVRIKLLSNINSSYLVEIVKIR